MMRVTLSAARNLRPMMTCASRTSSIHGSSAAGAPDLYESEAYNQVCPSPVPGWYSTGSRDNEYLPDEACYPVQACPATTLQHPADDDLAEPHPVEAVSSTTTTTTTTRLEMANKPGMEDEINGRMTTTVTTSTVTLERSLDDTTEAGDNEGVLGEEAVRFAIDEHSPYRGE